MEMILNEKNIPNKTKPKCKSYGRVKIVVKKDWIVKKVEKCWKKCKKNIKMSKKFFEKNRKKSEQIRKNQKNNQ